MDTDVEWLILVVKLYRVKSDTEYIFVIYKIILVNEKNELNTKKDFYVILRKRI